MCVANDLHTDCSLRASLLLSVWWIGAAPLGVEGMVTGLCHFVLIVWQYRA